MIPNDETILIGRVANQKSNTGSYIYNTLYRELGANALYLQFGTEDSEGFLQCLRNLNFRGCTVVGKHSQAILPFLDDVAGHAKHVAAVNTIVNDNGKWTGYKTDGPAMILAIKELTTIKGKNVVILGAGKIVKELSYLIFTESPSMVTVFNRTLKNLELVTAGSHYIAGGGLEELMNASGDIFINATDIGASPADLNFFSEDFINRFSVIFDATFKPFTTPLQEKAKKLGKIVIPGWKMFAYQGFQQVEYYLQIRPSINRLSELIREEFRN